MSEWSIFFRWFRDVGSVLGFFGGIILIIQYIRATPILKYDLQCYTELFEDENASNILIELRVDNIGDRATSIRDLYLREVIPIEYYPEHYTAELLKVRHISPHSSDRIDIKLHYKNKLILGEEIQFIFKVVHTHGSKILKANTKPIIKD